jgi:hypothetical protein
MIRAFRLIAGIAAVTAIAAPASAASDGKNRKVTVVNVSSQTLKELYASPITAKGWEEDLLGTRTLAAGASIVANVDNGTDQCYYDLKAVLSDGKAIEQRNTNVCAVSKFVVGDSGGSAQ